MVLGFRRFLILSEFRICPSFNQYKDIFYVDDKLVFQIDPNNNLDKFLLDFCYFLYLELQIVAPMGQNLGLFLLDYSMYVLLWGQGGSMVGYFDIFYYYLVKSVKWEVQQSSLEEVFVRAINQIPINFTNVRHQCWTSFLSFKANKQPVTTKISNWDHP